AVADLLEPAGHGALGYALTEFRQSDRGARRRTARRGGGGRGGFRRRRGRRRDGLRFPLGFRGRRGGLRGGRGLGTARAVVDHGQLTADLDRLVLFGDDPLHDTG